MRPVGKQFGHPATAPLGPLPAVMNVEGPARRLLGLGLDTRRAGIKDVRFGAILDEDCEEHCCRGR